MSWLWVISEFVSEGLELRFGFGFGFGYYLASQVEVEVLVVDSIREDI